MKISEKDFLEKVEEHKGILLKVSRMYCDDSEDRKDLFQEIILQMWKSIKKFNENSSFSTWMYRVAINTALIFHKQDKRRPDRTPLTDHEAETKPSYNGHHEQKLQQFYQATHHLNKVEKALILLYIEGHSTEQISTTLGISQGNTRVKVNRTKIKLQKIIEAQNNEL